MAFNIYTFLSHVEKRPAMYFGKKSVSLLRAYLEGFLSALRAYDLPTESEPPFYGFHDWVALRLGYYESTLGWSNMLLEAADGDEAKALDNFFVLLEEYKNKQARIILQAVPDATKVWRFNVEGDKHIPVPLPALVQIVKYTDDKGVFVRYVDENGELIDREEYSQDLEVAFFRTSSIIEKDAWK